MQKIMTIAELAQMIVNKIVISLDRLEYVHIDYKIALDFDEEAALKENYGSLRPSDWYGIHDVDTGFDSNDLHLVVDYYGGGCPSFIHIYDGMEAGSIATEVLKGLINTLSYEEDGPFAKVASEKVYVESCDPDSYRFVWKEDKEIGFYELCLVGPDGNDVEGSEMSLWDYTCEWQKENHRSRDINNPETFCWSHCWGSSSSRGYTQKDNMTLEQVRAEMQDFIRQLYIRVYSNSKNNAEKYKTLAEWCEMRKD